MARALRGEKPVRVSTYVTVLAGKKSWHRVLSWQTAFDLAVDGPECMCGTTSRGARTPWAGEASAASTLVVPLVALLGTPHCVAMYRRLGNHALPLLPLAPCRPRSP